LQFTFTFTKSFMIDFSGKSYHDINTNESWFDPYLL